jgi:hypothetical protein
MMHLNESPAQLIAHREQEAFLEALLLHVGSGDCLLLLGNLTAARREERSIRRALWLTVFLLILSGVGLCYCGILLPEAFRNPLPPPVRILRILALGALISQGVFLGCLIWQHAVVLRLHEECRRVILDLARTHLAVPTRTVDEGTCIQPEIQTKGASDFQSREVAEGTNTGAPVAAKSGSSGARERSVLSSR